jgi:hypothetical protein
VDDAHIQRAVRVVRRHRQRDPTSHGALVRHEHAMRAHLEGLIRRLARDTPCQPDALGEARPEHDVRAGGDAIRGAA